VVFGIGHDHECGQRAAVIVEVVQFDRSFSSAKFRPRKDAQAQIDHRGVHRKERVVEPEPVLRRDGSALVKQAVEQPFVNLPGPVFHGIRKRASLDVFQAEVIPFVAMNPKAGLDAPETVVTSDLGEQQRDELVPASEILRIVVALVLCFEFLEFVSRKIPEQLSQNRRNLAHGLKLLVNKADTHCLVTLISELSNLLCGMA